jgi:hypothetical protein
MCISLEVGLQHVSVGFVNEGRQADTARCVATVP